jgi:hypothetical protein
MLRKRGDFNIIYEYYKEKFDSSIHSPFISIMELPQLLLATGFNPNNILAKCCEHFDNKFGVIRVLDKDGNTIATL